MSYRNGGTLAIRVQFIERLVAIDGLVLLKGTDQTVEWFDRDFMPVYRLFQGDKNGVNCLTTVHRKLAKAMMK